MTMNGYTERSSRLGSARTIGVVWLLYFLAGIPGLLLARGIVVPGDAAATATGILAHASLFRASLAFDLVGNCVYIVLTILLYGLFRPVDRNLARLATAFSLVGCVVQIVGALLRVAPFALLIDNQPLGAFNLQQLQVAALLALRMYTRVFHISFVLFAFFELSIGFLILKSSFLPRWLGWLWLVAGAVGTTFLWPPLATSIFPLIVSLNTAELLLAIWLIVKGPAIDGRRAVDLSG